MLIAVTRGTEASFTLTTEAWIRKELFQSTLPESRFGTSDAAALGAISLSQLLVLLEISKLQDLLFHKPFYLLQQVFRDDWLRAKGCRPQC